MDLTEKKIDSVLSHQGKFLKVYLDRIELPDGKTAYREYVTHPGAVVIIAVLENGDLVFERQFRYPVGRAFYELPAGKIDLGEPILETAKRELLEETGYEAQQWEHLGVMHPCIGYSNEKIEIFLARDLVKGEAKLDEGEFLEVLRFSRAQCRQMVLSGEITDAKTITALYWADQVLA